MPYESYDKSNLLGDLANFAPNDKKVNGRKFENYKYICPDDMEGEGDDDIGSDEPQNN